MAASINLLPAELSPSGGAAKLGRLLNNAVFLGFTVFIVVIVGAISFFLINYFSLQDSDKRQKTLTTSIKSLEATETKLILVQNRLTLAKKLLAKDSVSPNLKAISELLPQVNGTLSLAEIDITPDKTEFSIFAGSSLDLAKFMATLTSGENYQKVYLKSFSYSPSSGYSSSFQVSSSK